MLRLSTPGYSRIVQSTHFDATAMAAKQTWRFSLAQMGHLRAPRVTRFPDELGNRRNLLRKYGVDTQHILWGVRLGLCDRLPVSEPVK